MVVSFRYPRSDAANRPSEKNANVVAFDDALKSLETRDSSDQSGVVEMRFFGGWSHDEIAAVLQVSVATVRRTWSLARAWLHRELSR